MWHKGWQVQAVHRGAVPASKGPLHAPPSRAPGRDCNQGMRHVVLDSVVGEPPRLPVPLLRSVAAVRLSLRADYPGLSAPIHGARGGWRVPSFPPRTDRVGRREKNRGFSGNRIDSGCLRMSQGTSIALPLIVLSERLMSVDGDASLHADAKAWRWRCSSTRAVMTTGGLLATSRPAVHFRQLDGRGELVRGHGFGLPHWISNNERHGAGRPVAATAPPIAAAASRRARARRAAPNGSRTAPAASRQALMKRPDG
jgi:hypothetical protein